MVVEDIGDMGKRVYKPVVLTVEQQLDRAIGIYNRVVHDVNRFRLYVATNEQFVSDKNAIMRLYNSAEIPQEQLKEFEKYKNRLREFENDLLTQKRVVDELQSKVPDYKSELSLWTVSEPIWDEENQQFILK